MGEDREWAVGAIFSSALRVNVGAIFFLALRVKRDRDKLWRSDRPHINIERNEA